MTVKKRVLTEGAAAFSKNIKIGQNEHTLRDITPWKHAHKRCVSELWFMYIKSSCYYRLNPHEDHEYVHAPLRDAVVLNRFESMSQVIKSLRISNTKLSITFLVIRSYVHYTYIHSTGGEEKRGFVS